MAKVILIVDDDPMSLKLVRDVLHVSRYDTIEAINGKEGVELAKSKKPALILMDMRMPLMSGFEATRILKMDDTTKDIPIVAMTASVMKGDEGKIHQVGCDGYLSKPIDIRQLLIKVKEYLPVDKVE